VIAVLSEFRRLFTKSSQLASPVILCHSSVLEYNVLGITFSSVLNKLSGEISQVFHKIKFRCCSENTSMMNEDTVNRDDSLEEDINDHESMEEPLVDKSSASKEKNEERVEDRMRRLDEMDLVAEQTLQQLIRERSVGV